MILLMNGTPSDVPARRDGTDPVVELIGTRPGKVIAVHLSFASRAAQRGRTPAHPSYFLKPSTSLTGDDSRLPRPQGVELLTFEGEIAVVIGRMAHDVTPDDAWSHVAGVTAANDLGIRDLKAADLGSNFRSKGADGFTPIGPSLLPAGDVEPDRLRVRTWRNGELVQDGSASDLLFDLPRLVSEASRFSTLEPGDVILTGTPAGASVAEPTDVIEVEVDETRSGAATGRLTTTIVAGPRTTEPAPPLSVDARARVDAWGSADAAGLFSLTSTRIGRAESVSTATLSSQLRRRGYDTVTMDGLTPLSAGSRFVGRARTLRFIAHREDLFAERGRGQNPQKRAIDALTPGDVLVVEARGRTDAGTIGDILALRARERGAAAVVTDGAVRDSAPVAATGLPVFAAGHHPAVLGRRHVPWEFDSVVTCAGVAVRPGDVLVGDDDGVVVIPPALFDEVVNDAVEQERQETFIAEQVRAGNSVDGLYPLNDQWKERYRAWATTQ